MLAGEVQEPGGRALDADGRRIVGVQVEAEGQAANDAERVAPGLEHRGGDGVQPLAEGVQRILAGVAAFADGDGVVRVRGRGGEIGGERVAARLQPGDVARQCLQAFAGQVLLVGVVLLQDLEPL